MNRRDFVTGLSSGIAGIGIMNSCTLPSAQNVLDDDESMIEKVKHVMFTMQRAPWEQGTAIHGLIEIGDYYSAALMAKEAVLRQHFDGRLAMLGGAETSTDPAVNGRGVLLAFRQTDDNIYKEAALKQYNYLKKTAPKSSKGILYHFISGEKIWSDSMFMAPPFLALMGDYDEAMKQIEGYREILWNNGHQLFSHMWNDKDGKFDRKAYWGGGNGWCAAAFAQMIDTLPENREPDKLKIANWLIELLDRCIKHMRSDGLFHDIIDNQDSFVETNLSQMLAYSIYKAFKTGYITKEYLEHADKMRNAAWTKLDKNGLIQDACSSPFFDRPGTSTEAQAFFLMMEGAYKQLK